MTDTNKLEKNAPADTATETPEKETGQGTSPDERGQFECHASEGEACDAKLAPAPKVDAAHPEVKKVPAVENPERPKDERALFDCDANGENCDS